jgi:hypothetical protein
VIDLGNGLKTKAQLTFPAIGKGPFPGVLLISGSGANDKNGTLGFVHKNGPKPLTLDVVLMVGLIMKGSCQVSYQGKGKIIFHAKG